MKRRWKNLRTKEFLMVLILFAFALATIIISVSFVRIYTSGQLNEEKIVEYDRHYIMIGKEPTDPFWLTIYQNAKTEGEKVNAYVENYGENLSKDYTVNQLLEMAVTAGSDRTVDKIHGIIVEADTSELTKSLINKACDKNMPVITILTDCGEDTKRKCFVGMDNIAIGESYGEQIETAASDTLTAANGTGNYQTSVLVLMDSKDSAQNQIYGGILEYLENTGSMQVEFESVNRNEIFSSDITIRDMLWNNPERPDILVCLNEEDTIAAKQVLIEYNLVGEVKVIGYNNSEEIIDGIQKGILEAAAVIDAESLGIKSVQALDTYLQTRHVTELDFVGTEFITSDNVEQWIVDSEEE